MVAALGKRGGLLAWQARAREAEALPGLRKQLDAATERAADLQQRCERLEADLTAERERAAAADERASEATARARGAEASTPPSSALNFDCYPLALVESPALTMPSYHTLILLFQGPMSHTKCPSV